MRSTCLLLVSALLVVAGCGGAADADVGTAMRSDEPVPTGADAAPATRPLAPELPGDDPAFKAAIDLFDGLTFERRIAPIVGLRLDDVSAGFFGQRLFVSLWSPVSADAALEACHELVRYANEIDFPANVIEVQAKTYADFTWSEDLVTVDSSGTCVPVG